MGSFSSGTFSAKPTLSVHSTNRLRVIIHWNGDRCLSSNYQLIHNGVKIRTPDGRNKRWLRGRVFRFPNQTLHLLTIPDQILIHDSPRFGRHPAITPHWSCRLVFFWLKPASLCRDEASICRADGSHVCLDKVVVCVNAVMLICPCEQRESDDWDYRRE